jgi:hypothetical protein
VPVSNPFEFDLTLRQQRTPNLWRFLGYDAELLDQTTNNSFERYAPGRQMNSFKRVPITETVVVFC